MAEEENNNPTDEETPEPVEPEAVGETPAEEAGTSDEVAEDTDEPAATPEPEPAGTGGEAEDSGGGISADSAEQAEEAPAEEAPAEEAPAEEAPAEEAPAEEAEEPAEVLGPKAARKRARGQHTGEAKPQRTPEERIADRQALRRANAAARRRRRASERSKRGEPGQGTPPAERVPGTKKVQLGTVVSNKADKTITVRVDIVRRHRRYEKVVRQSATVHAHDEANEAAEGDVVRVIESRPLSRTKRWRLVEVVEKAR
jgi:small subunit ribosomal protein S17